jgi:polyhydroxyalkanoate synthesis repressor PhaR
MSNIIEKATKGTFLNRGKKMSDVRIIKRYQNRKLYDTHQSCYVTLEEIAQIVREGHEIQVIDNKTKNDITYITQIQLLFDQEKKANRSGDVELLKRVIRSEEGTFTGHIKALEKQLGISSTEYKAPFQSNELNSGIETTTTLN